MKRIVTKEVFMQIFKDSLYRERLDKILLNFFGLNSQKPLDNNHIINKEQNITFTIMINTEIVLKIVIKDTKRIFSTSRHFQINFSYRLVNKRFALLIPGYIEIYCPYNFNHKKTNEKLYLIAALLECQSILDVKKVLKNLKIFTNDEIENILNVIIKYPNFIKTNDY